MAKLRQLRDEGKLGVVSDYMGDDPENVKHGPRKAFLKHLRERDHLLFAHDAPGSAAPGPASPRTTTAKPADAQ